MAQFVQGDLYCQESPEIKRQTILIYYDMPTYRILTQFTISESVKNSVTNNYPLESLLSFDSACSSVASWSKLSKHT